MKLDFAEIVRHFQFEGNLLEANPYGFGHINDTYTAWFRRADGVVHRYLLQRINHNVFKNPEELMQNIERVTIHLRKKIITFTTPEDASTPLSKPWNTTSRTALMPCGPKSRLWKRELAGPRLLPLGSWQRSGRGGPARRSLARHP